VGAIFGPIGYFFNLIFAYPIFNVLMLLDHLFGDFGLSIIILTVIIRLCLFPLTLKQLRSTKATQAIQPLMADVKKKYANDPQAQYRATQELYKEYNINPLSGCLPLFIQLPVLYGLYGGLDVVLRPANGKLTLATINNVIYPFLPKFAAIPSFDLRWFTFINPHWVLSLASPDKTFILPVLAGLAPFAQLRMSQARNQKKAGGASDMMTNQMQIMSFIMPFVTFFFALSFPAGLALYWTTSSIFSMVQQYFVTGWGSLFSMPNFAGLGGGAPKADNRANIYSGNTRGEKATSNKVVDSDAEILPERSTRSNNPNNSSTRRRRPNSSSARRRGSTPRRNPSRS
jgi:YidC/Oxa1 family membrane protein insertase